MQYFEFIRCLCMKYYMDLIHNHVIIKYYIRYAQKHRKSQLIIHVFCCFLGWVYVKEVGLLFLKSFFYLYKEVLWGFFFFADKYISKNILFTQKKEILKTCIQYDKTSYSLIKHCIVVGESICMRFSSSL